MEKIKAFQITELMLSGFKSFTEETTIPFGNPTVITGGNGRGKSSLADAIAFAVTGLPFFGERKIDRIHCDTNPNLFIRMRFVDEQGIAHELIRSRYKSRMTITYDGYEIRQLDLNDMFGERDVFLSIFNPLYFIEELGDEGKQLLERYLPQIPQDEVLAELSEPSRLRLEGMQLISPEGNLKRLREETRELDSSIIYLQGQMDLARTQGEEHERKAAELAAMLSGLRTEYETLEKKRFSGIDVRALQDRLAELSARYDELHTDDPAPRADGHREKLLELNRKLGERKTAVYEPKYVQAIAEASARVGVLKDQFKREVALCKAIVPGYVCPTCRHAVAIEDIPAAQASFRETAARIVADGKEQGAQLTELEALERKSKETFEAFRAEDIAKLERDIGALMDQADAVARSASDLWQKNQTQADSIRAEIQSITSDLEYGTLSSEEYGRMKVCGDEIRRLVAELAAAEKVIPPPAEDFKKKILEAMAGIEERKGKIDALLQYISRRAEMTFACLKMNRVAISLYDVMKTTGESKDTFRFTYNDRRYDRLSLSEKVRAGMEVSELFKKLTGRTYPTFVDNMESVDDLANVRPTGQLFMAKCVSKADLTVRPVKPITAQMPQAA